MLDLASQAWKPLSVPAVHFFPYATAYDSDRRLIVGYCADGVYELRPRPIGWTQVAAPGLLGGATSGVAAVADLVAEALDGCDPAGRPLFAANVDLPVPAEPLERLWQATTTWREHRGDGHVAALVAAGIGGCASHVLRLAEQGGDPATMQSARASRIGSWVAGSRNFSGW